MLCAIAVAQATLVHAAHRSDYQHLLQTIPPTLVLYAWLAGDAMPAAVRSWQRSALSVALTISLFTGWLFSGAPRLSPPAALAALRLHALSRGEMVGRLMTAGPAEGWARVIDYTRRCTRSDDRVVALQPFVGVYYFANRRFAGTLPGWSPGFFSDEAHQREWVARESAQPARLLIGDVNYTFDERPERRFATYSPLISAHLAEAFTPVGSIAGLPVRSRAAAPDSRVDAPPPCPLP
jgi:hypothetical protein